MTKHVKRDSQAERQIPDYENQVFDRFFFPAYGII